MKKFLIAMVLALAACATTPKGTTQTLYSAEWTLTGAANSVADLHDGGTLTGKSYEDAKGVLLQAKAALDSAKAAAAKGDATGAAQYLQIAQSVLNQLAAYLAAHGG